MRNVTANGTQSKNMNEDDFLAGLQVGTKLKEKDSDGVRYVLELPDNQGTPSYHLTGEADFCMCESWYEAEEMFERFENTGEVLAIKDIPKDDRTCSGCEDTETSFTFGEVEGIEKEELKEVLDILLDIAEEHYPKYSSSDNIAIVNDFYKKIYG